MEPSLGQGPLGKMFFLFNFNKLCFLTVKTRLVVSLEIFCVELLNHPKALKFPFGSIPVTV